MLPYYDKLHKAEIGCDEAGRGCLAGPVVAAAVIFPCEYRNEHIRDSKKISKKKRDLLTLEIKENALAYAIGVVSALEIDQINILQASILAMHRALDQINIEFDFILIDGNKFNPYKNIRHQCIIKGDDKYMTIAAASILAKTHRDTLMEEYHQRYPNFKFNENKGYPSAYHRQELSTTRPSPIHRMTFGQNKGIPPNLFQPIETQ